MRPPSEFTPSPPVVFSGLPAGAPLTSGSQLPFEVSGTNNKAYFNLPPLDSDQESETFSTSTDSRRPSSSTSTGTGATSLQTSLSDIGSAVKSVLLLGPTSAPDSESKHHRTPVLSSESATPTVPYGRTPPSADAISVAMSSSTPSSTTPAGAHSPVAQSADPQLVDATHTTPHILGSSTLASANPQSLPAQSAATIDAPNPLLSMIPTTAAMFQQWMAEVQQQAIADRAERQAEKAQHLAERQAEKAEHLAERKAERAQHQEVVAKLDEVNKQLKVVMLELEAERKSHAILAEAYEKDKAEFKIEIKSARDRITFLEAGALSKDHRVLVALQGRILSDETMKFLCWLLPIPGLSPDMWNGSRLFRKWLDNESEKAASKKGAPLDDDLRRKAILKAHLWSKIGSARGVPYGKTKFEEQPWLRAVKLIYESSEALDALTVKNYIVREEGNYSAHNLISLQKFAKQLADETNHMGEGPTRAMEVFIKAFDHIPGDIIPKTAPPPKSVIWSTEDVTPDATSDSSPAPAPAPAPAPTSSTTSPSSSVSPPNPASASTIRPEAPASTTPSTAAYAAVARSAAAAAHPAAAAARPAATATRPAATSSRDSPVATTSRPAAPAATVALTGTVRGLRASNLRYQTVHLSGVQCVTPGMVRLRKRTERPCAHRLGHAASSRPVFTLGHVRGMPADALRSSTYTVLYRVRIFSASLPFSICPYGDALLRPLFPTGFALRAHRLSLQMCLFAREDMFV
ncbi:hypothetical protein HYPSUDRAFT_204733 [Hypholoma sublateritium FD-334 SS-4]|uniref:Uncharacterized protein n=1 Tax=Hypholoma sublateritium (strain FD-334 SS-4) TaxID=945553 RepID=A0A0D2PGW7_HYPSF|nr:hypothetical protein HYPSUDRAFT_204733 [Hypholoma sublateritium FD-334 SS-4]